MAIVYNWPTSASLAGAVDVSRMHRAAGQEDLGFKIEKTISAVNDMQSSMKTNASAIALLESGVSALTSTISSIICNISAARDAGNISVIVGGSGLVLTTSYVTALSAVVSTVSNFRA